MFRLYDFILRMFGWIDPTEFLIAIIIGGSKSELLKLYGRRPNTTVLLFDDPADLAKLGDLAKELNATCIPLGRAQTADSLANQLGDKYIEAVGQFAPTDAVRGNGAAPLIGYMSALLTVFTSRIKDIVERLLSTICGSTNNAPSVIVVRVLCSVNGGTGSGFFRPIMDSFAETLARQGVNVRFEMEFVGPNGFSHHDQRIPQIAASVIPFAVAATMDRGPKYQELVTNCLTLGEYPSGLEEQERGELALVEEAAVISNEMQKHLNRSKPNHSTSSKFGNVEHRETDYFYGLSLELDILPQISTELLDQLAEAQQAIATDLSLITKVEFEERTSKNNNAKEVVAICEELFSRPPRQLIEALQKPNLKQKSSILFELVTGRRFSDQSLTTMFIRPIDKLHDAIERSTLLQTVIARLSEEKNAVNRLSSQVNEEISRLVDRFSQILELANETEEADGDENFTLLVQTGKQIRRLADEAELFSSRLLAVNAALSQVNRNLAIAQQEFLALEDSLKPYQANGMSGEDARLVEVVPLEDCFAALLTASQKSPDIAKEIHRWCVTHVTQQGLAKIVKAPLPTVNSIADMIVYGKPKYESSPYGGLRYDDAPITMVSIPPVVDEVFRRELRQAIKARDPRAEVFFADTIGVGANVLRFRYRYPKSIQEIMRGTHARQLRTVLNSATRQNFFPGDTNYLRIAGIIIKDNDFEMIDPQTAIVPSTTLNKEMQS